MPLPSDPITGVVGDKFSFDKIIEIEGWQDATKGQKFFAGNSWYDRGVSTTTMKTILRDNSKLYFYTINTPNTYVPVITKDAEIIAPAGISANSYATLSIQTYDWYLGIGSMIYKSNSLLPNITDFLPIPAESGEITALRLFASDTKLMVATYKADSPKEQKGSAYIIDLVNKKITDSFPNVTGKAVDIFVSE